MKAVLFGSLLLAAAAKNLQNVTDMVLAVAKFVSNPLASLLNH